MTLALLIGLAWKSGLVAAVALLGAILLRGRPAAERVALLRLGVVMILLLPVLTFALPAMRIQAPALAPAVERPAPDPVPALAPLARAEPVTITRAEALPPTAPRPAPIPVAAPPAVLQLDPAVAGLLVYLAGVAVLVGRLLAGVATLSLWTRRARPVADGGWLAALDRAAGGGPRPVLLASPRVLSPLSWGVRPAVILLNEDVLPQADRADAVLTHELGHVRRGDWLFLMLSRVLVALFWFNPLIWLLERELARQSEQAADAWAVRRIGPADYASALVAMAARARPHAALGMAAPRSELARRVTAVLAGSTRRGRPWPTALAAVVCVGFATPLAAVEFAAPTLATAPAAPLPDLSAPVRTLPRALPPIPAVAFAAAPAPPADDPNAGERLATVLRQRDQGLAVMDAGARAMEQRAQDMRDMAARLPVDAEDKADLIAEAADLENEARDLRNEARDLAARDPSTLRPLSPQEERDLADGMQQVLAVGGSIRFGTSADVTSDVRAAGAVISAPMQITMSSPDQRNDMDQVQRQRDEAQILRDVVQARREAAQAQRDADRERIAGEEEARRGQREGAEAAAAGREEARRARDDGRRELREGAQQLRQGALEIEAGAREVETAAAANPANQQDMRNQAAGMRNQAADLRRRADEMEARSL